MPDQHETHLGHSVGEYLLVRRLGGGGFGTVYLAEHVHDHTQAAVKVLHIPLIKSQDFKEFLNEARAIRLRHPHIVPLLDFGISRDDLPFLVMEYAQKGTMRDRYPKGERLALSSIISYVDQIASALQCAHDQRVIHRDVKPANILVRADGTLMVSDFGIAKFLEQSLLTSQEKLAGTPEYMAPEQHKGKLFFASDQYALAVVVYEWICGVRPFQGTLFSLADQHMNTPAPPLRKHLPTLPEAVERVVLKALAKVPGDRFERIQEFANALHETIQPSSATAVLSQSIEARNTAPLVTPLQASKSTLDPKPEPLVHISVDTGAPHLEPALQTTNQPSPQDSPYNVSPSFPRTSLRTSPQPKRWRVALVLILFILVLIGVGTYTAITTSHRQATSLTPSQVTATAQARADSLGRIWHSQTSGTTQRLSGVAWSGTQFVVVGDGAILTSPDGRTWTPHPSGSLKSLIDVVWSGTQFVVVGLNGTILTSPDGITWTLQTSSTTQDLSGVAWSRSQFVVVGDGAILTSPDGRTWTPRASGTTQRLNGVVWSGTQFVAVGLLGAILTSPDGITWTPHPSGSFGFLYDVAWSGTQFVVVGEYNAILTSPDGITWTPRTSRSSEWLRAVVWSSTQFVIVADGGTILTSLDGITWTPRTSGTSEGLEGIVWSGSQFVVVGYGGTILTSP